MSDILQDAQETLRRDEAAAAQSGSDLGYDGVDFNESAENPSSRISDLLPDFSFLLAPTGPGSIEEYVDHPLNGQQSRGMAQMIRGFTGICGQLDYAIVDIALGAVNYMQEGKKHEKADRGE